MGVVYHIHISVDFALLSSEWKGNAKASERGTAT